MTSSSKFATACLPENIYHGHFWSSFWPACALTNFLIASYCAQSCSNIHMRIVTWEKVDFLCYSLWREVSECLDVLETINTGTAAGVFIRPLSQGHFFHMINFICKTHTEHNATLSSGLTFWIIRQKFVRYINFNTVHKSNSAYSLWISFLTSHVLLVL